MSCEACDEAGIVSSGGEIDWLVGGSPEPDYEMKRIKPEVWERYQKQVKESGGFDVDYFPGLGQRPDGIVPTCFESELFAEVLSSAIAEHNQRKQAVVGAPITLKRIIKLNSQFHPGNLFYTFEATDAVGTTRTYQAQLSMDDDTDHALILREKSSPDV